MRRAFSAAIDRQRLVDEIYDNEGLPMRHLSPPGVVAAPPIDEIGVGYSPDDARHWLAQSGFGSCRLIPPFTLLVTSSDLSLRQAELIRDMWVEELGCAPEQIIIDQVAVWYIVGQYTTRCGRRAAGCVGTGLGFLFPRCAKLGRRFTALH